MERWEAQNLEQQQDRNAILEKVFGTLQLTQEDTPVDNMLNSYFNQGATKLGAYVDSLNKDHDSAATRYDTLLAYNDRHYVDAAMPVMETQRWSAVGGGQALKALDHSLRTTGDARKAITEGDLGKAERLIKSAITAQTNDQNFLRKTFFELRKAQGKSRSMSQNLQIGLGGTYPSLFMHIEDTKLKLGDEAALNPTDGEQLLRTFTAYGSPADYYNEIIPLLQNAGMGNQALKLTGECLVKYVGDGISCSEVSEKKAQENDYSYQGLMKSFM
jgi:hypothetical protein